MSLPTPAKPPATTSTRTGLFLIEKSERRPLAWAASGLGLTVASFTLLRPIRDAIGLKEGPANLVPILMWTVVALTALIPAYNIILSRIGRVWTVNVVFALGIGVLVAAASFGGQPKAAWPTFIALSVYGLALPSTYQTVMADLWTAEQARRAFPIVALGGTVGAFSGAQAASLLAARVSTLFILSATCVVLAVVCLTMTRRHCASGEQSDRVEGSTREAAKLVLRHSTLLTIAGLIFLAHVMGTWVYIERANIIGATYPEQLDRMRVLAQVDALASLLTILLQLGVAGRLIRAVGVRGAVISLPIMAYTLFVARSSGAPAVALLGIIAAIRAAEYGLAGPAREMLFPPLSDQAKYRAKGMLDTVFWRAGDFIGSALSGLFKVAGIPVVAAATVCFVVWTALGLSLRPPCRGGGGD